MLALVLTAGSVLLAQDRAGLAPAAQVPVAERLWIASVRSVGETPAVAFERLKNACGSASTRAWRECTARWLEASRVQIATLHAAPDPASPVVGSVFQESVISAGTGLEHRWSIERVSEPGRRIDWPGGVVDLSGDSYRILGLAAGTVEYRREIPSDVACGNPVNDPVPPTLRAPIADLFVRDGQARFSVKHAQGC
jgi:hypothetical protein